MYKRSWVLTIVLAILFSAIWLLPKGGDFQPSLLKTELPEVAVGRQGYDLKISDKELKQLAPDTSFLRKRYIDGSLDGMPPIDISIVFAGKDVNNSIHRPEVCLEAQGWNFISQRYTVLKNCTPKGGDIPVKEIVCERARTAKDKGVVKFETVDGKPIYDRRIQYYTFMGKDVVVAGHYQRTWEDIKTRLTEGKDQQWAYVTFSMDITEGKEPEIGEYWYQQLNVEQTRASIADFVSKSLPSMLRAEPKRD